MRPIKIIMSAFGSYGGVEEVGFETIERGLFLVTGDTGAGKTTIFDAITYALFDETSGGKREGDMMRSSYADDTTPTFVELTFSYRGEIYKIRRNPNYKRVSKRKNKDGEYTYTTEAAAVELTLPDGSVYVGKNKETNEKIKEILGVDVNQFTQISMIAQGEFLKLLHAPSKERKEIFSRIFDTRIYGQVQSRLREESKQLYIKLDKNHDLLCHEIQGVWFPSEKNIDKWMLVNEKTETGKEEILQVLEEILSECHEEEVVLKQQEEQLGKRLDELKVEIARAKEIDEQFQEKKRLEEAQRIVKEEIETLKGQVLDKKAYLKQKQEEWETQQPQLIHELEEAKAMLPRYQQLEEKQRVVSALQAAKEQKKKLSEEVREKEERAQLHLRMLQTEQKELLPQIQRFPVLQQEVENLKVRLQEIEGLHVQALQLQHLEKKWKALQQEVERALKENVRVQEEYNRYYHIFIQEQAGLMAAELEIGKPCPVCGATEHPKKAELSKEAVSQKQVEMAKDAWEKVRQHLEEKTKETVAAKEKLETERRICEKEAVRLFGEVEVSTEEALRKTREQEKQQKQELSYVAKQKQQYEKNEQELEKLTLHLTELLEKKETLQKELHEAEIVFEKEVQTLETLKENLKYPSKEVLEAKILEWQTEMAAIEKQQKQLMEVLQHKEQEQAKREGMIGEQEKQILQLAEKLKDKEPVEMLRFWEEEQVLQKKKQDLEEKKVMLYSGKERNQRAQKQLCNLYQEREHLKEKYQIVETLSQTANGNLRQRARLDLQTYVQRRYFKHIIGEANRRLMQMSNGKFILKCRELESLGKQGEAGLDLDVYDMITDQIRDVKTLSGGESFLAALSMALGMADVVKKNAAKVHLDTMFIDEGFGSLDDESRDKALMILQELAGEHGLVGIISHVTELKEQMDKKLIITKSEKGSRAEWK